MTLAILCAVLALCVVAIAWALIHSPRFDKPADPPPDPLLPPRPSKPNNPPNCYRGW